MEENTTENFEDALEEAVLVNYAEDMEAAAQDVAVALSMFLDDRFDEAVAKMTPWADKSIYHSIGNMFFYFMEAFLSFEATDIQRAIEVIKASSEVCNRHRHPSSITNNVITKMVVRPNYDNYSEVEIHAELCAAECLLGKTLLTFIQDDSLLSFIRGSLRIRTCFQTYKECNFILKNRNWPCASLKEHFESGVYLGLGMFNLIISSLPKRVLKLLEFIGFPGDMAVAMELLEAGHNLHRSLRGPICSLLSLLYHTCIRYLLGKELDDVGYFDDLVPSLLAKYPRSSIITFMAGRLQHIGGNAKDAIEILTVAVTKQVEWDKFRQFPYWELCFCNIVLGQYRAALGYMEILRAGSNWSKAIYTYLKAAILCMCDELTESEREEMIHLMEDVPSLKQRIVGKSLPAEKFVEMKSKRFLAQDNWLLLPAFEMMYGFSYFLVNKGKVDVLSNILAKVEQTLEQLKDDCFAPYYMDNYCLAVFLKGVCLSYMGSPLSAEELFMEVYENEKEIKEDRYLVACALLELGLVCKQTGNYEQAIQYLNMAKKETIFYTEFRIHQALQEIEHKMQMV